MPAPLILASRSPQRRAILQQLRVEFDVDPAEVEELEVGDPVEAAAENARRKARVVAARRPGALVLGADTVVALNGRILSKPAGPAQAAEWLRLLSGRTHDVVGGVCLVAPDREREAVEVTHVTFHPLSERQIEDYVAGGEWRERAGGYAIQGAGGMLVAEIEGSYSNVVGLPKDAVRRMLTSP